MTKINFNLPISNLYSQGLLELSQHEIPVEIELTAGDHLFTSEPVEIGNYFNYKVFSQISIPYSYDPNMQYITIAGPDDIGDKQLAIHTSLDRHPSITNTFRLNNRAVSNTPTNLWSDFINKAPDVKEANNILIRQAIDSLAKQLLNIGVQGVIQTGAAPIVTPNNYHEYKDMFLPSKANVKEPLLEDIFEVQSAIQSIYFGTITWNLMYSFANVIGSTFDPLPNGRYSWIQLWIENCNKGNNQFDCSSYNYSDGKPSFSCGTNLMGGHVIDGTLAKEIAPGSTVYIFPICVAHGHENSIYMSLRNNPTGVILHNYYQ